MRSTHTFYGVMCSNLKRQFCGISLSYALNNKSAQYQFFANNICEAQFVLSLFLTFYKSEAQCSYKVGSYKKK